MLMALGGMGTRGTGVGMASRPIDTAATGVAVSGSTPPTGTKVGVAVGTVGVAVGSAVGV